MAEGPAEPSDAEHRQHMEIDRITTEKWRVSSGKWQRTAQKGNSSKKVKYGNRELKIAAIAIIG